MRDVETRLFRYFVAVAEEQHFSRAALRLRISAPTLSHQIKKLESQLAAKLFNRKGNTHVELTEAGSRLLDIARAVLRQVEEVQFVVQRSARGEIGHIEVGFMPSALLAGVMQKMLREFRRENPAIDINVHRLVPNAQIAAIVRKDLDVGFTRSPHKYPAGVDGFEIFSQPMIVAIPSGHALAQSKTVSPAALKDEMFVNTGPELDIGFWGHTEAVASVGKFTPNVVKRDDDLLSILTYVSMGYGIGVVPQSMSKIDVPNVVYREIAANPVPRSAIAFVYRKKDSSPSAELLRKYMQRHALPR